MGRVSERLADNQDETNEEGNEIGKFLFLSFLILIALNTANTNLFLCHMHRIGINSCVQSLPSCSLSEWGLMDVNSFEKGNKEEKKLVGEQWVRDGKIERWTQKQN